MEKIRLYLIMSSITYRLAIKSGNQSAGRIDINTVFARRKRTVVIGRRPAIESEPLHAVRENRASLFVESSITLLYEMAAHRSSADVCLQSAKGASWPIVVG